MQYKLIKWTLKTHIGKRIELWEASLLPQSSEKGTFPLTYEAKHCCDTADSKYPTTTLTKNSSQIFGINRMNHFLSFSHVKGPPSQLHEALSYVSCLRSSWFTPLSVLVTLLSMILPTFLITAV